MYLARKLFWIVFFTLHSHIALSAKINSIENFGDQYKFDKSEYGFGAINLSSGEIIALHNEDQLFNSASLVKIITTYIGLKELGPDFRWQSEFYYTGEIDGNTLKGNIIFKGRGDASFSVENLEAMIRAIQNKGIKIIEGDLIFDSSYFGLTANGSFFDNEPMRAYNVLPNAISIQSNTINFKFENKNGEVTIEADPSIKSLNINNNINATMDSCHNWLEDLRYETKITNLNFSGKLSQKCGAKEIDLAMLDSQYYFYQIFKQKWIENGGWFDGDYKVISDTSAEKNRKLLASHYSDPLSSLIRDTNKYSLNLMARNLMLTIVAEKYLIQPREEMVNSYINNWLLTHGLDADGLFIDNGAGLSRNIKISVKQFLMILKNIYYDPMMPEMISSFPIAGIDGTLKKRMRSSSMKMNGHFKTGSMNNVSAIAGFFLNKDKEMNIFIFMMNGKKANESQKLQEALIETLL
jgi:serine-type D-Ala-D-Ala carboxypeptidase/endopeptidase (penicillin-binding protein 4)